MRRVVLGTGFLCPPIVDRYPNLRVDVSDTPWRDAIEVEVLENINHALNELGAEPAIRISDVFDAADATFLLTLKELDHYQDRSEATYLRPICELAGEACQWPSTSGKRIFVYLKPSPEIPQLLDRLAKMPHAVLFYSPSCPQEWKVEYSGSNIQFADGPVDIHHARVESDLAIHNAGHGLTCEFLLRGKPQLLLPLFLEQQITARRIESLGAGRHGSIVDANGTVAAANDLLNDARYAEKARKIAAQYQQMGHDDSLNKIVGTINGLLSGS